MRVLLFSLLNWLYDDSNLIKALLIALAVLVILTLSLNVYYHKIVEKFYDRGRYRPYKRLRSDWEPKRPNDLTNSYDNPWDVLSGEDSLKQEEKTTLEKVIKALIWLGIFAVIAIVVLIIVKIMG